MTNPPPASQRADLRDYLAAERTFLAWIRTGLALMGFGFVVARFGLFLQQMRFLDRAAFPPSSGLSLWFGTALISVGVIVNLASIWRHTQLVRELNRGESGQYRPLSRHSDSPVSRPGRNRHGHLFDFRSRFYEFSIRN